MTDRYFAGVDGGGTRTTLVLADGSGRELARRGGPAGLVDPRDPAASAAVVAGLVREAVEEAGLPGRPAALCAGLAGVGNAAEREAVRAALDASAVADVVLVTTDGAIALEGSLAGGAGVLLIAGTGSVAYGRGEDGRVERCGGWGMWIGDEGSGYAIGRGGLAAAVRAVDGRGPPTVLLDRLLPLLDLEDPRAIPPWVGRAAKADVAALARVVLDAAGQGDEAAWRVVEEAAAGLAEHVEALWARLAPWSGEVPVVFHGGVLGSSLLGDAVGVRLHASARPFVVRPAAADAVDGALRFARGLVPA